MTRDYLYTANQPMMLGGPIYFWNRYANVRHLVFLGDAQVTRHSYQSRIDLLDKDGKKVSVHVPLKDRGRKTINEVEIDDPKRALGKLSTTLHHLYGRVARDYLERLYSLFSDLTSKPSLTLGDFNRAVHWWVICQLGAWGDIVQHELEKMPVECEHPSARLAAIGAAINCKGYVCGESSLSDYLRTEDFGLCGIQLVPQRYQMRTYLRTKKFAGHVVQVNADPTVSIIDPLFIGGPDLVRLLILDRSWT